MRRWPLSAGLAIRSWRCLCVLNRQIPQLRHLRQSRYVHPERLFETFLGLAGELATFTTAERRAR